VGRSPELRSIAARPYLGHRFEVPGAVGEAVDGAFATVFGCLGEAGATPTEAPFNRFHELGPDGTPLAMEVGVVADFEPGPGDPLAAATLPAGRFVTYLHHGAYRSETEPDLAGARALLEDWAAARGLRLSRRPGERGTEIACYLERYLVGPAEEPDQALWRTELAYLVDWP
jgi:hypothetical protein